MARVELRWTETDPARPALDVLVRLVALTDQAWEDGHLDDWLMTQGRDGEWTWAADLPDDLRSTYHVCPVRDAPLRGAAVDEDRWYSVIAQGLPDPHEPDRLPPGCVFGAADRPASVLSMPAAPAQPWTSSSTGRAPCTQRDVWPDGTVVTVQPPLEPSADQAALLVLFDGESMQSIGVPQAVEALQAAGAVGPTMAVYVESIAGSTPRGPSRIAGLTEAAGLERLVDELLPRLHDVARLDPAPGRHVVAGHSLGGLAALHLATTRPGLFGAAAAGSAALWWPGSDTQLSGATVVDALLDTLLDAPAHPRLWLEVGTFEGADLLAANRGLHTRATAADLDIAYREVTGGHDLATWRGGIADALVHLLPPRA